MSAELDQLKVSFEQLGMSPEEIAEDRQLDINSVKAGLMQCSAQYRKLCSGDSPAAAQYKFSEDARSRVLESIVELALGAENEAVRLKAAMYVRDDSEGRLDAKQVGGIGFNILQFNNFMQQTRKVADTMKQSVLQNGKVIDVQS